jgi:hypothetical protein
MTEPELERLATLIEDRIKKIRASIAKQSGFYAQYEDQGYSASKVDGLAEALYIIREQTAEPSWIALMDEIPATPNAQHLTYSTTTGVRAIGYWDATNGQFRDDHGSLLFVDYWTPLPPPPTGESS